MKVLLLVLALTIGANAGKGSSEPISILQPIGYIGRIVIGDALNTVVHEGEVAFNHGVDEVALTINHVVPQVENLANGIVNPVADVADAIGLHPLGQDVKLLVGHTEKTLNTEVIDQLEKESKEVVHAGEYAFNDGLMEVQQFLADGWTFLAHIFEFDLSFLNP